MMNYYLARSFTSRSSIGYLMRRGATLMRDQLERALAAHDVTFAQWVTLVLVQENPGMTAGELCRELHHDSGALTRLLDQLEGQSYLKRTRGVTDRRVVRLRLTAAGRRALTALMPPVVERMNAALGGFSAAEVTTLVGLMNRLIAQLEHAAAADNGVVKHRRRAQ
jgi:DNA-binding MarR family transcriptional regulator